MLAAFLVLGLLLGGSSRTGGWPILLVASLCLLLLLTLRFRWRVEAGPDLLLGTFLVGLFSLPLVQLVPLPPSVWTALPGRDVVRHGFDLLEAPLPWMPVSLDPAATFDFWLALIPPAVIVLIVGRMRHPGGTAVSLSVLTMALVSVFLGLMQVQQGEQSALYFHQYSNRDSAVGFFANANHLATLLLLSLPLGAALIAQVPPHHPATRFRLILFALHVLIAATAILLTRSVAGLLLLVPTTLASGALLLRRVAPVRLAVGALLLALPAFAFLAQAGAGSGTSLGGSPLDRLGMARTTLTAAADLFPLGGGLGSFPAVYRSYEDLAVVPRTYANHAHDEYIELWLDGGVAAVLLVGLFLAWAGRRGLAAWRAESDQFWPRAAAIQIWIIALHSLVDYPARTPAIAMLLAWAVATLALHGPRCPHGMDESSDSAQVTAAGTTPSYSA